MGKYKYTAVVSFSISRGLRFWSRYVLKERNVNSLLYSVVSVFVLFDMNIFGPSCQSRTW